MAHDPDDCYSYGYDYGLEFSRLEATIDRKIPQDTRERLVNSVNAHISRRRQARNAPTYREISSHTSKVANVALKMHSILTEIRHSFPVDEGDTVDYMLYRRMKAVFDAPKDQLLQECAEDSDCDISALLEKIYTDPKYDFHLYLEHIAYEIYRLHGILSDTTKRDYRFGGKRSRRNIDVFDGLIGACADNLQDIGIYPSTSEDPGTESYRPTPFLRFITELNAQLPNDVRVDNEGLGKRVMRACARRRSDIESKVKGHEGEE